MASNSLAISVATSNSRSKSVPWFHSKIGSSLTPAGRQLLEQYSGIKPSEVESHVYKIVSAPKIQHASSIPQLRLCTNDRHSAKSHGRYAPGLVSVHSGSLN